MINLGINIQTVLRSAFLERRKGEDSAHLEKRSAVKSGIKRLVWFRERASLHTSLENGQEIRR